MTHRAFYSLAEHEKTDLIWWARSHGREYLMVVFPREWRASERERTRVRALRQICGNRVARLYSASNGMVSPNRTRKRWGRHNKSPWDNLNLSCRVWTKNLIDRLGQPGGRGKGFSTAGPGEGDLQSIHSKFRHRLDVETKT